MISKINQPIVASIGVPALASRWKPYPAYKDSSVEWLGEVPEHWEMKRLRFICEINPPKSEVSRFPSDTLVSFLPMEMIDENGMLSLEETRTIEQVWQGFTYFKDNDVILAKITPCFENGKGATCSNLSNGIGFGTTELHVLRSMELSNSRFIYYLTKSDPFRKIGTAMMYGAAGQQRVPEDFVKDFRVGLPPLPEQRAIATFLDRRTAALDVLISKKERLIELLQEKRAALIGRAVTKGLDPNVPMKDSGVEWLGEIPAHWQVKKLKYLAKFYGGGTPAKDNIDYWVGVIPWVSPKDMKSELIMDTEDHITDKAISESATCLINQGAVLIVVRSGILKHSVPVAINSRPVALNQDMKAIVLKSDLNAEYLASVIRGCQKALLIEWRKAGATVESIEYELLINTHVPVPPLPEQRGIASFLDRETARIDALIARIHEGIEKLREYRTALISAAVTGKIDVREVV